MGIRFYCPNGHKLHVKAFLAGKRGICPKCGAKVGIPPVYEVSQPGDSETGSQPNPRAPEIRPDRESGQASPHGQPPAAEPRKKQTDARSAAVDSPAPATLWYVRAADGEQYGPADERSFQAWVAEGRISAECLVWREGWEQWQPASVVVDRIKAKPPSGTNAASPTADPSSRPSASPPAVAPVLVEKDAPNSESILVENAVPEVQVNVIAPPFRNQSQRRTKMTAIWILGFVCVVLLAVMAFVFINTN